MKSFYKPAILKVWSLVKQFQPSPEKLLETCILGLTQTQKLWE